MRAVQLTGYGDNRKLRLAEVPVPEPGPGEVLIRVRYAGLNPVDFKTRKGQLRAVQHYSLPQTMGNEVAGVIAAVGEGVTGFSDGDAVYTRLAKERMGGFADYAIAEASIVAPKPQSLSMRSAAGVPLVALTAWQCLFDYGGVSAGDKVLIHAGAGAVGRAAIQMAKNAGATVATTVSARGMPVVKELGVDVVINYREQAFDSELGNYDFVLDAVGGRTTRRSMAVLRRGGKLCSIAALPERRTAGDMGKMGSGKAFYAILFAGLSAPITIAAALRGVDYRFVFMRPDGDRLRRIGEDIDVGRLRFDVAAEYPLEDFAQALDDLEHGRRLGKLVLAVNPKDNAERTPASRPDERRR